MNSNLSRTTELIKEGIRIERSGHNRILHFSSAHSISGVIPLTLKDSDKPHFDELDGVRNVGYMFDGTNFVGVSLTLDSTRVSCYVLGTQSGASGNINAQLSWIV